jgi:hypothetical protein
MECTKSLVGVAMSGMGCIKSRMGCTKSGMSMTIDKVGMGGVFCK